MTVFEGIPDYLLLALTGSLLLNIRRRKAAIRDCLLAKPES
jgi:hypothetical protein